MTEFERVQRGAWQVLMCTTRHERVALQIGYLIDTADSLREVLLALAMIGEFEIEEEGAQEEAALNVPWEM